MNNQSTSYGKVLFTRVSYPAAKRLYESGNTLHVITSNMRLDTLTANLRHVNQFLYSTRISLYINDNLPFSSVCNRMIYYNCNSQTGMYLKFFIESEIKDGEANA